MFTPERQQRIIAELAAKGRVEVGELVDLLQVSEATVRRDLKALAEQGYLQKTHGGAVGLDTLYLGWNARAGLHAEAKRRIGKTAASLVEPGQTVILDAGSTALEAARFLEARPLTVITNSLDIAQSLEASPQLTLLLTGGEWDPKVRHFGGEAALTTLRLFRADWCFLGVSGVHPKAGITSAYGDNAAVKRAMVTAADRVVALADASKLGEIAPHFVAGLGEVFAVATEDAAKGRELEAAGARLLLAHPS
ncbi:MAG: DeoR/GlpR family DNA-binding transcription regulator [Meiothermus sp.]|nr:DeoR/GlpR family DNA-binding transcription regulator [Meiothermus sp.]